MSMQFYKYSSNGVSDSSASGPGHHSLDEMFQCMWDCENGTNCDALIRGHSLSAHSTIWGLYMTASAARRSRGQTFLVDTREPVQVGSSSMQMGIGSLTQAGPEPRWESLNMDRPYGHLLNISPEFMGRAYIPDFREEHMDGLYLVMGRVSNVFVSATHRDVFHQRPSIDKRLLATLFLMNSLASYWIGHLDSVRELQRGITHNVIRVERYNKGLLMNLKLMQIAPR
ncbi:hypothetical protein F4604DRAFT_1691200 [Suillus subluteus]|nr:hypothetical protein F4604DRAFT_1691200 [Suillus subluteus]